MLIKRPSDAKTANGWTEIIHLTRCQLFIILAKWVKNSVQCKVFALLCRCGLSKKAAQFSATLIIHVRKKSLYLNSLSNMIWLFKQEKCIFRKWSFWVKGVNKPFKYKKLNLLSFSMNEIQRRKYFSLFYSHDTGKSGKKMRRIFFF